MNLNRLNTRSSLKVIAIAVALLSGTCLLGDPAMAAVVVDQNQPASDAGFSDINDPAGSVAQSFQQTANNIAGAGVFLSGSNPDNITIALWTDLPSSGGTFITSGTATATSTGWLDVFWSPVPIAPGTTEYLIFSSAGLTTYQVFFTTADAYPAGSIYFGQQNFSGYDATFRTYSDTEFNAAVPEPTTWAMMILGFAGIGFMAYRRKSKPPLMA